MTWHDLPAGALGAVASTSGIDANLVWADSSGFIDFVRPGATLPDLLPFIVELKEEGGMALSAIARLQAELQRLKAGSIPAAYLHPYASRPARRCTAWFTADYCREVLKTMTTAADGVGSMIDRFELQLPVIPQRPRPLDSRRAAPAPASSKASAAELLVGAIDSGCPFAHRHFRDHAGLGTRVLAIWDQDDMPAFQPAVGGGVPPAFGYGSEIRRPALNTLMAAHRTGSDVSEDACYAACGYFQLRHRLTHGAAVLGLFAAPLGFASRSLADPDVIPRWTANPLDRTNSADIAFVQLPRDAVQDSSSAGLARLLLDGLRYIVGLAGPKTKRIVVNISDGSSRGSHDGDSIFELAMLELIDELRSRGISLEIVLAAGNSFNEARHGQLDTGKTAPAGPLTLRLPPSSEAPAYVVVRIPAGVSGARITALPPGSRDLVEVAAGEAKAWPSAAGVACSVVYPRQRKGRSTCALIAWAPTVSGGRRVAAPCGDWELDVEFAGKRSPVHFYICRNQTNPGALARGVQARFVDIDGQYDPRRPLRRAEADSVPPRSAIRREGTLTSLATPPLAIGLAIVGGISHREQTKALYSSVGPAAGDPPHREGPDAYAATDESRALRGIRSSGSRSGDTVRVAGTSFAAPQIARWLANRP